MAEFMEGMQQILQNAVSSQAVRWVACDLSTEQVANVKNLPNIKEFMASSIQEARRFFNDLETTFMLRGPQFPTESSCVLFAASKLTERRQERWHDTHDKSDLGEHPWESFKEAVLDMVEPKATRMDTIDRTYVKAFQKKGQSVIEFAAYLESLERQMPWMWPDADRRRQLMMRLDSDTYHKVQKRTPRPETREELVKVAAFMENLAKQKKEEPGHRYNSKSEPKADRKRPADTADSRPDRNSENPKKKKRSSFNRRSKRSSTRRTESGPGKSAANSTPIGSRESLECYKCHEIGHWALDCPLNQGREGAGNKKDGKVNVARKATKKANGGVSRPEGQGSQ